jgi:predicted aminopeptidase
MAGGQPVKAGLIAVLLRYFSRDAADTAAREWQRQGMDVFKDETAFNESFAGNAFRKAG